MFPGFESFLQTCGCMRRAFMVNNYHIRIKDLHKFQDVVRIRM